LPLEPSARVKTPAKFVFAASVRVMVVVVIPGPLTV
jgi:hypothetical protein